ncbi:Solute carrier 38 member [Perkinsus olseni]|uniref:Solute carrier 38 member n=1 Tax=Perkinsus olseni TaxID=32597 RepID=A0A7J6P5W8_PEROL|nr:Solute carrier 38 member [Perkinsus olseni]
MAASPAAAADGPSEGHESSIAETAEDFTGSPVASGSDTKRASNSAIDAKPIARKSFLARLSQLNILAPDGRFSAVFNLAAATLGAGALAVPVSILDAGIVGGVLLLFVMGILSLLSIVMIAKACYITGKPSYEELLEHLFGKGVCYGFDVVMILFCFGTCVTYLITLFDILSPVLIHFIGPDPTNWFLKIWVHRIPFTAVIAIVILLPLSLRSQISEIRYVTFLGVLGVLFLAITSIYVLCRYGVSDHLPSDMVSPVNGWTSMLAAINTYTFAYCNQPNVPEIYIQVRDPTPKRFIPVVVWTIAVCFIVYVTVGLMNFLAFGMDVKSSIIINLGQYISQGDVMVCISFALECITIIGAFPLVVYPQRSSIVHAISACLPPRNAWWKKIYGWIVVVLIIGLSYAVAIALPDVNVMLGLVGSLTGSIVTFYSPAAFILKISKKPLLTFDVEHIVSVRRVRSFTSRQGCQPVWAEVGRRASHKEFNFVKEALGFEDQLKDHLAGYAISSETLAVASRLVEEHQSDLLPDSTLPYSASPMMMQFWLQANGHEHRPQCLYGAATALWILGRAGGDEELLRLADHLLGATETKRNLAFLEDSEWPLSVVALVEAAEPSESSIQLLHEDRPREPRLSPPIPSRYTGELAGLVVWEVGVHASLSAEVLNMLRLVGGSKLEGHRRLVQRQYPPWLLDICGQLYSGSIGCDTHRDELTDIFESYLPDSDTSNRELSWESIEAMRRELATAGLAGSRADAWHDRVHCTGTLCYFGHPALFMVDRSSDDGDTSAMVWSALVEMSRSGVLITSDPFLSMQYEYQLGVHLPFIRTHGLYSHATHRPIFRDHVLVWDRPHDTALMGTLQHVMDHLFDSADQPPIEQRWSDQPELRGSGHDPDGQGFRTIAGHSRFRYTLVTRKALKDTSYRYLSRFNAISALPVRHGLGHFLRVLFDVHAHLHAIIARQVHFLPESQGLRWSLHFRASSTVAEYDLTSPFDEGDPRAVLEILEFVDYFALPGVRHFGSLSDLLDQLQQFDVLQVEQASREMRDFFHEELTRSVESWRRVWLQAQHHRSSES